jgi:hypothetical protein
VGTTRTGKGEGAGKGGTSGDAPRRWRDDGATGSALDGGVPVEGWLWLYSRSSAAAQG